MSNSKKIQINSIKPTIISFIGMMGSGKTKMGKSLSKYINYNFYDIDEIIEQKFKMTITKIFQKFGEKVFREKERIIIKNKIQNIILNDECAIVSLGGGGFEHYDTRKLLLKKTFVIWLDCPIDILLNRLGDAKTRPMLQGNITHNLNGLLKKRKKNYNEAHMKFDTSTNSSKQIIMKIKEHFNV
tara:strand:+ start:66 stop:620 length:555 start_codon:yes stop_codon:yes gene_type:complete